MVQSEKTKVTIFRMFKGINENIILIENKKIMKQAGRVEAGIGSYKNRHLRNKNIVIKSLIKCGNIQKYFRL